MNLARLIGKSIWNPAFYQELLAKPFSFSVQYFLSLTVAVSIVMTVSLSVAWVPAASRFLRSVGADLVNNFPDELTIIVEKGEARVNVPEPYRFPLPETLRRDLREGSEPMPEHLFVVDTTKDFTLDQFNEYSTFVFLTKRIFAHRDQGKSVSVVDLADFPDAVIDKVKMQTFAGQIDMLSRWVAPIIIFGVFFGVFLGVAISTALYLLLGALFVWVIARIKKVSLTYGKSYQVGLHAATLSIVLYTLLAVTLPHFEIPGVFTAVFVVVVWLNLRGGENVRELAPVLSKDEPSQTA